MASSTPGGWNMTVPEKEHAAEFDARIERAFISITRLDVSEG
jgi:hypothetical protein